MIAALFLLAAAAPPVAPPAPAMDGLFVSWRDVAREAEAAERAAAVPPRRDETQARALGEQVGETVARGDCDGGERMAREAGDLPLLRAVQAHCRGLVRAGARRGG
jgi:hypothetical protein